MLGDVLALVVAYAAFVIAIWYLQARDERRERQREADQEQQRKDEPDLLETTAAGKRRPAMVIVLAGPSARARTIKERAGHGCNR